MTETILTIFVAIGFLLAVQIPIARACSKNPAIGHWRPVLIFFSLVWAAFFVARVLLFADNAAIKTDAIWHEHVAQEVAGYLRGGDFQSAFSLIGVGNEGFEFCVGVICAITHAPQVVVVGGITFMAFCGLLTLLDILARSTQAARIPFWIVFIVGLYPEGMFWSTDLWKEGLVLWGMCTMLRFVVPDPTKRGIRRWIAPIMGTIVFAFLRPHIAFAWLVAITLAQIIKQRRWGLALVSTLGICVSFLMMMVLAPRLMNAIVDRGMIATMEAGVSAQAKEVGQGYGSQLRYTDSRPIPVITGLTLLFLRPYPWEAPHWVGLLAGFEILILTTIMLFSWVNLPNRRRYITQPLMLTAILVTLFLAFFFSYMFNLGLTVRQRIQFFPAMITLAATPALIRRSPQFTASFRRGWQPQQRAAWTPAGATARVNPAALPQPRMIRRT